METITRQFWCVTCKMETPMTSVQIAEHVRDKHLEPGRDMRGRKITISSTASAKTHTYHLPGGVEIREVETTEPVVAAMQGL